MTDVNQIRVLVVDDHKVVRTGLRTFLSVQDDLVLVGEAGNGEEAIEQCAALSPDVVLMDLKMPVMDGPTAIARINERFPDVKIVALTSSDDGTIAQAVNIPLDDLRDRLAELPRDKELLVFCAIGPRGYLACRILSQNGFACRNLTGGYKTYKAAMTL